MTIKLASLKADLTAEEKGEWIEYPDWPGVAFNVSSLHLPAYVTARDLMLQRQSRKSKGKPIPADVLAHEGGTIYAKHILHGWRGLDVEYSPEVAVQTLTDPAYRAVRIAVEWCAGQVAQVEAEFIEEAEKNSAAPSATR